MTQNRFLAAAKLLLGQPVVRITFPPGSYHYDGPVIVEGVGLELKGAVFGSQR